MAQKLEKTKVVVRLRPFNLEEKKRGAEGWPTAVTVKAGGQVLLGYEPAYSSNEPPSSVGRLLAARVASSINAGGDGGNPDTTPGVSHGSGARQATTRKCVLPLCFSPLPLGLRCEICLTSCFFSPLRLLSVPVGTPETWEQLVTPPTPLKTAGGLLSPMQRRPPFKERSNTPLSVGSEGVTASATTFATPVKATAGSGKPFRSL